MGWIRDTINRVREISIKNPKLNALFYSVISAIGSAAFVVVIGCFVTNPLKTKIDNYTCLPDIEQKIEYATKGGVITEEGLNTLKEVDKEIHEREIRVGFLKERYEKDHADVHEKIGDYYTSLLGDIDKKENVERAIKEYEESKKILEQYKEDYPDNYLRVMISLGLAYYVLSDYRNPLANMEKSRVLLEEAEKSVDPEKNRHEFIRTHTGLGDVYLSRALWNIGVDSQKESNDHYASVLYLAENRELPVEEDTLSDDYAKIKYAMGVNLIGKYYDKKRDSTRKGDDLRRAINYLEDVSGYWLPDKYPREYKQLQNTLGIAYLLLSRCSIGDNLEYIEKGRLTLEGNLVIIEKEKDLSLYIEAKRWLACTYFDLYFFGDQRIDDLDKAVELQRDAINESFNKQHELTHGYGIYQEELAYYLLISYFRKKSKNIDMLKEAVTQFEGSLRILCTGEYPMDCMDVMYGLGRSYLELDKISEDTVHKRLGIEQYENVLELYATDNSDRMDENLVAYMVDETQVFLRNGGYGDTYRNARTMKILGDVFRRYTSDNDADRRKYHRKAISSYNTCLNSLDTLKSNLDRSSSEYLYSTIECHIGDCNLGTFYISNNMDNLRSAIDAYDKSIKSCYDKEIYQKRKEANKMMRE